MKTSRLSDRQLKKLYQLCVSGPVNIMQAAKAVGVTRNTIKRHIRLACCTAGIMSRSAREYAGFLAFFQPRPSVRADRFKQLLSKLIGRKTSGITVKKLWIDYRES